MAQDSDGASSTRISLTSLVQRFLTEIPHIQFLAFLLVITMEEIMEFKSKTGKFLLRLMSFASHFFYIHTAAVRQILCHNQFQTSALTLNNFLIDTVQSVIIRKI